MLIFDGKNYREATPEEVAEFERIAKEEEEVTALRFRSTEHPVRR